MMRYTIIKALTVGFLAVAVEDHMAHGWICQGGICVDTPDPKYKFYQAMVRIEPKNTVKV